MVLLAILVIVFGAKRLPRLGEALGKAVVKYRQASRSRSEIEVERVDDKKPSEERELSSK